VTPDNGFAVDLTVLPAPSLDSATVARIVSLDVQVTGADTYHKRVPLTDQLVSGALRIVYRPGAASGTLDFVMTGLDGGGIPLALGQTSGVQLVPGATTSATVTLYGEAPPDLGSDATVDAAPLDGPVDLCPPGCSPGATRCAGFQVQSCVAASGCWDWGAPADCPMAQFCSGTACAPCPPSPVPEARSDLYVKAGFSGGNGDPGCPLGTVTAGLAAATATSATSPTVHVGAGSYSAGESFPLVIRNGISLVGDGLSSTFIKGSGNWVGDSYPFNQMASYSVTIVIGSDSRPSPSPTVTNRLKGVTVQPGGITMPTSYYYGVMCDRGNAVGGTVAMTPAANVIVDSCQVGPNFDTAVVVTDSQTPAVTGCNLQLLNSLVTGGFAGVFSAGCPAPVNVQLGDGTSANANLFSNLRNDLLDGDALSTWDCSYHIEVLNNTFRDSDGGMQFTMSATYPAVINIRDNVFTALSSYGVVAAGPAHITDFLHNRFTGIGGAAGFPVPFHHCALCLGGRAGVEQGLLNQFIGNEVGVEIIGNGVTQTVAQYRKIDFGHTGELGNNIFSCNSNSSGNPGHDFWVHDLTSPSTDWIWLQGNMWDHAEPTTDASDGSDLPTPSPTPAPPVLELGNEQPPAAACTSGKMP
jgi:hypothetical protein